MLGETPVSVYSFSRFGCRNVINREQRDPEAAGKPRKTLLKFEEFKTSAWCLSEVFDLFSLFKQFGFQKASVFILDEF